MRSTTPSPEGRVWVWGGVFSLRVPPGWQTWQREAVIEITPPNPVGAAHISVISRTRQGNVDKGEARRLVSNFAQAQGVTSVTIDESAREDHLVATTEFDTGRSRDALRWIVEARVWRERAFICSFCCEPERTAEAELARTMFSTITILESVPGLSDPS
jgi:hypothetical protein